MIYVTGDCHGDWSRFSEWSFPEQKEMTRDDFVIVCGDFGIWNNFDDEIKGLEELSKKSFTILFVDGNHENFDRLYSDEFPVVDFHGGKAHQIRENIYHLMRGNVFELCGKKFFTFGGASSHDIDDGILDPADFNSKEEFEETAYRWYKWCRMFRIKGMSWWEQELPTEEEMAFGIENLERNNNEVDYIITHCCPQQVASLFSYGVYKSDRLTQYFNTIAETVKFKEWYFGHYHDDRVVMSKFHMLYWGIERIV